MFEWFGIFLSIAGLLGMVGLLAAYDGKKSPNWQIHAGTGTYRKTASLTINTIVSIFSTLLKSGLLIPVGASLSQLKWLWFAKGHPLSDFQMFEAANRGPLGSVLLLWGLRGRRLACLAAIIIIASLAVDFSLQALIVYPLRPVSVGRATLNRANYFVNNGRALADPSMLGAIYSGIYQYEIPTKTTPVCATGNCTWNEVYTTLGVCGKCFDVSQSLKESCGSVAVTGLDDNNATFSVDVKYCNQSLPNGFTIPAVPSIDQNNTVVVLGNDRNNSVHFSDMDNPISILSRIRGGWGGSQYPNPENAPSFALSMMNNGQSVAVECGWYYCVQRFNASVKQGILTENLLDVYSSNKSHYNEDGDTILEPGTLFTNTTEPLYNKFRIDKHAVGVISDTVSAQWDGAAYCSLTDECWASDAANLLNGIELPNIEAMADNLATSMTIAMRALAASITNESLADEPVFANGTAYQDQPHVEVRWGWIALPAILQLLALILLVGTIISASQEGAILWKGSTLAAFSHPLTKEGRAQLSEISGPREMHRMAEHMAVKYERTGRGHRLVQPAGT